jgi:hypothetical protein
MTMSSFSPKPIDVSPKIYYYLGKSKDAWEKGEKGSDERV